MSGEWKPPSLYKPFDGLNKIRNWGKVETMIMSKQITDKNFILIQNGPFLCFFTSNNPYSPHFILFVLNFAPTPFTIREKPAIKLTDVNNLEVSHYIILPDNEKQMDFLNFYLEALLQTQDTLKKIPYPQCMFGLSDVNLGVFSASSRAESIKSLKILQTDDKIILRAVTDKFTEDFLPGWKFSAASVIEAHEKLGSQPVLSLLFDVKNGNKFASFMCLNVEDKIHWLLCLSVINIYVQSNVKEGSDQSTIPLLPIEDLKKAEQEALCMETQHMETVKMPRNVRAIRTRPVYENSAESSSTGQRKRQRTRGSQPATQSQSMDEIVQRPKRQNIQGLKIRTEIISTNSINSLTSSKAEPERNIVAAPDEKLGELVISDQPSTPVRRQHPLSPTRFQRSPDMNISQKASMLSGQSSPEKKHQEYHFKRGIPLKEQLNQRLSAIASLDSSVSECSFEEPTAIQIKNELRDVDELFANLDKVVQDKYEAEEKKANEEAERNGTKPDRGYFGTLPIFVRQSTREIVVSSVVNNDRYMDGNVEKYIDFKVVPALEKMMKEQPPSPPPFVMELSSLSQQFVDMTEVVTDCSAANRLVFLISAIFLNGHAGFVKNGEAADMTIAFNALKYVTGAVQSAIDAASNIKKSFKLTSYDQIVAFVAKLLNDGSLIPLLMSLTSSTGITWTEEHYIRTAYLRSNALVDLIPVISTIVKRVKFDLPLDMQVMSKQTDTLRYQLVTLPSFYHLEISDYLDKTKDRSSLLSAIVNVLEGGMKLRMSLYKLFEEVAKGITIGMEKKIFRRAFEDRDTIGYSQSEVVRNVLNEGIHQRKVHLWIAIIASHSDITSKYYYDNGALRDMVRTKYIICVLGTIMKKMGAPRVR